MSERPAPASPSAPTGAVPEPSMRELLRWLLGITRPVHPPLFVSLLCRIANLSLDIALFATAAGGVVHVVTGGDHLVRLLVVLVALALAKASFYYLEQFTGHYVAFKALELLRTFVYAKLWPQAPAVVSHSRSGDVLASLTRDVDRIEVVYAHTFAPVVSAYVVGPIAVVLAGTWVGWSNVWVVAACLALSLLVVPYVGMRRAFRATDETLQRRRDLSHQATDSVFGLAEVIGYGRESERLEQMDVLGERVAESAAVARRLAARRRGSNVTLMLVAAASVVWLGADSLTLPVLAALAAGTLRLFEGPRGVEDSTSYLDHSLSAARRLWHMANTPQRVLDGPQTLRPDHAPAIRFDHVSYTYPSPDRTASDDAISDVSLAVPAGGHAIVVGRSGSGKSTLVQMLLRYDDPREGSVLIDDVPVSTYTLDSLRRTVVAVSQRNQVLTTSLRENLLLGAPDVDEADLWDALGVAGLADEVRAMPDGLDTFAGPGGSALSGGQLQRLCLARALVMRPKVLVLDEFAANLNLDLEDEIRSALRAWDPDLTVIEVTHRLRATAHADVVVMLDRGRVVLSGTPDEVTPEAIEAGFAARSAVS